MPSDVEIALRGALAGPVNKAVSLECRWFKSFAQNHDGHAALVLRVSLSPNDTIPDGRGFRISTARGGHDDYVRVTSISPGTMPVFIKLVELILDRVNQAASAAQARQAIADAVQEFRSFSGRVAGRLTDNEVRGLFAECVLLNAMLDTGIDGEVTIGAWRGPYALAGIGNHDFVFASGRSIEVKAIRQGSMQVAVSSAGQLVPSSSALDLVVLPLEPSPAGLRFRDYVHKLGERIKARGPVAADAWEDALAALRLDLSDEWYDQHVLLPGEWLRYSVRDDFPHVDVAHIPLGLVNLRYSLDLPSIHRFVEPMADLMKVLV